MSPFGTRRTDEKPAEKQYTLPETPIGISANKLLSDGNYVAILFVEEDEEKNVKNVQAIEKAIASVSFVRKPIRFFMVRRNDSKEADLTKNLAVSQYPCFVLISTKGVSGLYYDEIEKEKLLEFMKTTLK